MQGKRAQEYSKELLPPCTEGTGSWLQGGRRAAQVKPGQKPCPVQPLLRLPRTQPAAGQGLDKQKDPWDRISPFPSPWSHTLGSLQIPREGHTGLASLTPSSQCQGVHPSLARMQHELQASLATDQLPRLPQGSQSQSKGAVQQPEAQHSPIEPTPHPSHAALLPVTHKASAPSLPPLYPAGSWDWPEPRWPFLQGQGRRAQPLP